jgi:hypothetical protein
MLLQGFPQFKIAFIRLKLYPSLILIIPQALPVEAFCFFPV